MSSEENKAVYRRFMDEVVNNKQLDLIPECIAADMVEHTPGLSSGAAGLRQDFEGFFSAFPDMQVTIEDLVAEGDKVARAITGVARIKEHFWVLPQQASR